ncbi:MAG: aspartate carbamoyltransferase regulatory subunit [Bacteroidales bacterium]|jgi:aspartate carbamoyltransferase regulatory subunit|nr:aspartate carbamoyltransferase regulatory subunit [Bacteroidales bacterium]MDD2569840.1 aspartate carbamoyltransferase regulatory subunit [Bacteroidales bacterium]MDD2811813.1 aspartate carbamoyltransferase regulatory subunit [Bacteroidales bacterium]MDD3384725.1 aspartate carbamoyltransferase regulatory subunit [Bacteroidales bacterium]MDD3810973.1 aspartate carbamoyltransferase regulatory subunit [Bacteroidales bacterium]
MQNKKELKVSAIRNGTVIDHIPSQNLFSVINILGLNKIGTQVTFGFNLESKKLGKKAIIKVADKFFEDDEINKISLVAPDAKLNIIRDYQVVEKRVVSVPDEITAIAKCMNPKCISNHEDITTRFDVIQKKPIQLKCLYCEKITDQHHLEII